MSTTSVHADVCRSQFARFLDDQLTIIVLMNGDDVDRDSIVHGVAAFFLPAPKQSGTPLAVARLLRPYCCQ